MTSWQIAQVNEGRLVAAHDHADVAGFFAQLDAINALAGASPGFVWRLQGDSGNATDFQPTPDPRFIVNISVWDDADALFAFVYRSAHVATMAQRKSWFERCEGAWWVPPGHRPTIDEALSRLWRLDRYGPSGHAFTFNSRYPVPGAPGPVTDMRPDPWCVGWT